MRTDRGQTRSTRTPSMSGRAATRARAAATSTVTSGVPFWMFAAARIVRRSAGDAPSTVTRCTLKTGDHRTARTKTAATSTPRMARIGRSRTRSASSATTARRAAIRASSVASGADRLGVRTAITTAPIAPGRVRSGGVAGRGVRGIAGGLKRITSGSSTRSIGRSGASVRVMCSLRGKESDGGRKVLRVGGRGRSRRCGPPGAGRCQTFRGRVGGCRRSKRRRRRLIRPRRPG